MLTHGLPLFLPLSDTVPTFTVDRHRVLPSTFSGRPPAYRWRSPPSVHRQMTYNVQGSSNGGYRISCNLMGSFDVRLYFSLTHTTGTVAISSIQLKAANVIKKSTIGIIYI